MSLLDWIAALRAPRPEATADDLDREESARHGIPAGLPSVVIPKPGADILGASTLPPTGPAEVLRRVILPTLAVMEREDGISMDPRATRMLLAICGQEADWRHRDQIYAGKRAGTIGPATGLFQFERAGGVAGVLRHTATAKLARRWCERADVKHEADAVWRALVGNDALACAFARLLLWSDPRALPKTEEAGWEAYLWCWRPGKPHRPRWSICWAMAEKELAKAEALSPPKLPSA